MNIIITGASSGVGFEAVLDLIYRPEAKILALARSKDKLERLVDLAKQLNPDAQVWALPFDTYHGNYQRDLLPAVGKLFPNVDVLINNAGQLINKPFSEQQTEDFETMMQHNFFGHVRMIQALLPFFAEPAHILNIGSMGGFQGSAKFSGLSSYSASKAALHNLTECLAEELKLCGIKVNCLALGSAQTEMLEKAFPGYESPVQAFEMGAYIADFALNGAKFFNGKVIPVAAMTP